MTPKKGRLAGLPGSPVLIASAVRAARAGTPVAVIQAQLGHASPMLTLSLYGRFMPSAADRKASEAKASAADDQARRHEETA